MAQAINCNFARTAIRTLCQREFTQSGTAKRFPRASIAKVVEEYNTRFSEQDLKLSLTVAYKRIPELLGAFNRRWNPQSQKGIFLNMFSLSAWTDLPSDEKSKHSLQNCLACRTQHVSLTRAFPDKRSKQLLKDKEPSVSFNDQDLSSLANFGKKALNELNAITGEKFNKSVQDILSETPQSKLIVKPSSQERQSEMRRTVRLTKKNIQQSMDESGIDIVMRNRISWRKFDEMRKSSTLESHPSLTHTPSRKRMSSLSDENVPPAKRKHGSPMNLSTAAEESILAEAQLWSENEKINWSALARRYGLTQKNGGQSIKEFLRDHNIAAASKQDCEHSVRRKRKTLPGGVPFPMQHPSSYHKKKLFDETQSGEVPIAISVVPTVVPSLTYNKEEKNVVENDVTVYASKVPLTDIRRRLLEKHEKLGLIRQVHEDGATRYLKIWHDHSSIAGHGHFLVLVSVIYDSALFLTQEEADLKLERKIDVQSTIETPELHILGRSSSSIEDQALFSACRNECLSDLSTPLCLSNDVEVNDIMRFFHGDGPAQQFEAGNSIGGNYCCVSCGVRSDRMDDIAYAYRCQKLSLEERQKFLLQGTAWKNIASRPLDKLLVADLRNELSIRGLSTEGKKKPVLEKEFEDIRLGITNFPALLQNSPEASLHSLNLPHYEVSPTEPLHDLKGHFSNIIEESLLIASGKVLDEIKKIKKVVLTKEVIRCSDLRKAVILIYLKLKDVKPEYMLTDLFRTAVDIANLCYAHDAVRSPRSILCLYNRTFLHAYQCSILFSDPKSITRRKMFGRYYHSLTAHAALLFRMVSLRSMNTEQQERIFQQAKGITKGTSNNHPQHIISNILQRLHFERGSENVIATQESQIKSLSTALGPMENTIFPKSMLQNAAQHYQAHLEQISDYLIHGPGVWWKETPEGIMFLDGSNESDYQDAGPTLQHFRSTSLSQIDLYLQQQWEVCCNSGVMLPATYLRFYGQDGTLEHISESTELTVPSCDTNVGATTERLDVAGHDVPVSASHDTTADVILSPNIPVCTSTDQPTSKPVQSNVDIVDIHVTQPSQEEVVTSVYKYKSHFAQFLFNILDHSHQLQEFDKLRFRIKNAENRNITRHVRLKYKKLDNFFQNKLLISYKQSSDITVRKQCRKLLIHEWGLEV